MDKIKKYKVILSKDALEDIKDTKKYILDTFKYRQYAEDFSKKLQKAVRSLSVLAAGYKKTGFAIESMEVYYKPYSTYLIFFVIQDDTVIIVRILKDRMYWQSIINRINNINK